MTSIFTTGAVVLTSEIDEATLGADEVQIAVGSHDTLLLAHRPARMLPTDRPQRCLLDGTDDQDPPTAKGLTRAPAT